MLFLLYGLVAEETSDSADAECQPEDDSCIDADEAQIVAAAGCEASDQQCA